MPVIFVAEGFSPPPTSWKAKAFHYIARSASGLLVLLVALAALAPHRALAAPPEPVTVRASVDRDRVTVGDRVTLTILVEHDEGLTLDTLEGASTFGAFEVLAAEPPRERPLGAGRTETTLVFTVAAFRTGDLEVPAIAVPYSDAAGNAATATAPAIPITVASVIPPGESPTDVRDLKPQLGVPGGAPAYLRPTLTAAVAAVAVGLALVLARALRRRRRAPAPAGPPPLPEDEARAELERIAALRLPEEGAPKEHYRLLGELYPSLPDRPLRLPGLRPHHGRAGGADGRSRRRPLAGPPGVGPPPGV